MRALMVDWSGRRTTVTGAGGFIGSHLVERLVEVGADVRALVRYNSRGDRGALDWIEPSRLTAVDVLSGDIRDYESATAAVAGSDIVFHLAAHIGIPYSYRDPRGVFNTNVMGTLNIAQACREAEVQRLVHTSTSEIYGTAQQIPITEDHPIVTQSPYSASKASADHLVASFHRSFGLPVTILRPFNTYGPRQSARAVIPTIISQALWSETVKLGSLEPSRDLTFVDDTVAGFLTVAECSDAVGQTLQLGTGEQVSVRTLVETVGALVGRDLQVQQDAQRIRPENSEVMQLISSPRRMAELTGWAPRTVLRDGLEATVTWIEAHPERYRAGEYAV